MSETRMLVHRHSFFTTSSRPPHRRGACTLSTLSVALVSHGGRGGVWEGWYMCMWVLAETLPARPR